MRCSERVGREKILPSLIAASEDPSLRHFVDAMEQASFRRATGSNQAGLSGYFGEGGG
jgi:hypothetical protein